MNVHVTFDTPQITEPLQRQAQWAAIVAATWLAKDAQEAVRANLPSRFTLRNDWTRRQIRITPATREDTSATVRAPDYMAKQETGGRLNARSRFLGAPTAYQQRTNANRSIRDMRNLPNVFVLEQSRGVSIRQRLAGGRMRILYWMTHHQDYAPRFDFQGQVERSVNRNLPHRWAQAMANALAPAK